MSDDEFVDGAEIGTRSTTSSAPYTPSYRNINIGPRGNKFKACQTPDPHHPETSTTMSHPLGNPILHTGENTHQPSFNEPYQARSNERLVHVLREENLRSWNLKFTGDSDIVDFFLRIDDFMRSREISESKVVKCFSDLLGGKALDYYRQIRDDTVTLKDLTIKFKTFFSPVDSDFVLEKGIRDHKQSAGQLLSLYILEMRTMNSRLTKPLEDSSLIEIIKHNISPAYAHLLAVSDINNLDQLTLLGKRFEAYAGPPISKPMVEQPRHHKQIKVVNSQYQRKQANPIVCKKCKRVGHSYRQCRTIPGVVCFRCGEKGALSSNCPKCHPQHQSKPNNSPNPNQKN